MSIKIAKFNAGPQLGAQFTKTPLPLWKTIVAYVVSGLISFVLGWALYSFELGVAFLLWTNLVGPLTLPFGWWFYLRLGPQKLKRLDLEKEPALLTEFLKNILSTPGPRIRVWVRKSSDINFLWFELPFLRLRASQDLIVTTQWLQKVSVEEHVHDWNQIWKSIASQTRFDRNLRSFQIILWISWLSFLSPVLFLFDYALKATKITQGVKVSFFLQYWAWRLKQTCFEQSEESFHGFEGPSLQRHYPHPRIWNSLQWGVWVQIPARAIHPLWKELTHRNAFLNEIQSNPAQTRM